MRNAELYAKILGLTDLWLVDGVNLDMAASQVVVRIGRRDDAPLVVSVQ